MEEENQGIEKKTLCPECKKGYLICGYLGRTTEAYPDDYSWNAVDIYYDNYRGICFSCFSKIDKREEIDMKMGKYDKSYCTFCGVESYSHEEKEAERIRRGEMPFTKPIDHSSVKKTLESHLGEVILIQGLNNKFSPKVSLQKLTGVEHPLGYKLHLSLSHWFGGINFGRTPYQENIARIVNCRQERIYEDEEVIRAWEKLFLREEANDFEHPFFGMNRFIERRKILKPFGVEPPENRDCFCKIRRMFQIIRSYGGKIPRDVEYFSEYH